MVILGFIQSLLGAVVFLFKKPKHTSYTILGFWLIINSLIVFGGFFEGGIVQYFKPGIFPLMFLYGPLLLFYVKSLIDENFRFKRKQALHLIPFLALCVHRSLTDATSITNNSDLEIGNKYNYIYFLLNLTSILTYWFFTIFILTKHRKRLSNHFSYKSSQLTLNWTWAIVLIFIVVFFSPILFTPLLNVPVHLEKFYGAQIFQFNHAFFSFLIILFGLRQPIIFENKNILNTKKKEKYIRSGLSDKALQELENKINTYLNEEKPYLNPEFNLQAMSTDLGISRQNLSQVLNEKINKNFYRLINELRVNEVKKRLEADDSDNFTVIGIALESGFNSKASFNRIFKEITSITPSEYKKGIIKK